MRYCLLILLVHCFACNNQSQNTASEFQAVKDILVTERKAHLSKDVSLLLSNSMDTVLEVSRGVVKTISLEEGSERFKKYFNSVEFIEWDNIAQPSYYFSDDSSMAVVIVQKRVIVKELSGNHIDTTDFAWTSIFRRQREGWKLFTIASTNK